MKFKAIVPGKKLTIDALQIRAINLNHVVETVGYMIEWEGKAVMFLGDTGPTKAAWRIAQKTKGLRAIFVETSLPDSMKDVAEITGHLTPFSLQAELKKLKVEKPNIYLHHIKLSYHEIICKEVAAIKNRKIQIIEDGQIIRI